LHTWDFANQTLRSIPSQTSIEGWKDLIQFFTTVLGVGSQIQDIILHPNPANNKVQFISFIRIEKSPSSRWRNNSKANTSSGSHRKNQTRGDKKQTRNETHTPVWTKVPVSHLFRDHQQ
jgi:hypothetical protein